MDLRKQNTAMGSAASLAHGTGVQVTRTAEQIIGFYLHANSCDFSSQQTAAQ